MKQIFLYGLGQSVSDWNPVLKCFPEALCPDYLSETPAKTYGACLKTLSSWIQELPGKEDLQLIGLSLGAMLAIDLAYKNRRISSLILIAPQIRPSRTLLKFQNLLFRLFPPSAFSSARLTRQEMIGMCQSMMDLDLSRKVEGLEIPGLILLGEKDKVNVRAKEDILRLNPRWKDQQIKGAAHEVNRDQPALLVAALHDFASLA